MLKADSSKFFINDYKVMFITDTADNFDNETAAGVSQEQFEKKLSSFKENRLFSDFLFGLCYLSGYLTIASSKMPARFEYHI